MVILLCAFPNIFNKIGKIDTIERDLERVEEAKRRQEQNRKIEEEKKREEERRQEIQRKKEEEKRIKIEKDRKAKQKKREEKKRMKELLEKSSSNLKIYHAGHTDIYFIYDYIKSLYKCDFVSCRNDRWVSA